MLRLDSLPAETRALLDTLAEVPDIAPFTLVGGTALALSWGHRLSEDLDFAVPALDLPRAACTAILDRLGAAGWQLQDITDPMARLYHEAEGADLHDSQQDWLCRRREQGVKLTLFADYLPAKHPAYAHPPLRLGHVRVMPPAGLFLLKSQLLLRRSTLRDLYDMLGFLERGATIAEVLAAACGEIPSTSYETLRAALLPARPRLSDPGLASLVAGGPDTLEALRAALLPHLDAHERHIAEAILRGDDPGDEP